MSTVPKKILRLPALQERLGLAHTAIYELIKRGEFPRPIKLTQRSSGWLESDAEAFLACREVASRGTSTTQAAA